MLILLQLLSFGLIIFSLIVGIRNQWVYKQRIKLIKHENDILLIDEYEDYDTMFYKFWIWDVEKFKKKKEDMC